MLERDRGIGLGAGADVPGALLVTGALMLGVYTIVEAADYGWGSAHTLGPRRRRARAARRVRRPRGRARNPLMPLRIFRSRNVAGANLVQVLMVAGMFGMFFLGALYLQQVLGYGARVGLAFLPVVAADRRALARLSPRADHPLRRARRAAPRARLSRPGWRSSPGRRSTATTSSTCCRRCCCFGVGAGLGFPALMTLAMSGATPSDAGLASGLVNTTQQVGGALGLAVLATLSTTRTDTLLAAGDSAAAALTSGYRLAFAVGLGFLVAAVAAALALDAKPSVAEQEQEAFGAEEAPEPAPSEAA